MKLSLAKRWPSKIPTMSFRAMNQHSLANDGESRGTCFSIRKLTLEEEGIEFIALARFRLPLPIANSRCRVHLQPKPSKCIGAQPRRCYRDMPVTSQVPG